MTNFLNTLKISQKYSIVYDIVKTAVYAVEQTNHGHGDVKKNEAFTYVKNKLEDEKIKISSQTIDTLIESAVFEMNNMEVDNG